ncbi:penicillin acylase family protein [Lewinella cohaerens]|uniref:penicillin acylase family protein n=1 Tax=Lewinella cohaerens TaxID=70995 RepID=UPI00036E1F25|nr:penicillin acylase family protein [Lewinella cohaerens]
MRYCFLLLFFGGQLFSQQFSATEIARWEARAAKTEIIRDEWGIPHIYAPTDADAVFGMLYAQCEDDFPRVERNYLEATGQMALAFGEEYLYHDLRARMWMDSTSAKTHYNNAPEWLQALCDAFADGINFYLHTHPKEQPLWINKFEPWMPFTFTEGSIGPDITRVSLNDIAAFYGDERIGLQEPSYPDSPADLAPTTGSNGFAVGKNLVSEGKSLLLINPHVTFHYRSEQHVNSDEGLASYGAVTWGQFFVYQGFNEKCGWMHTSTWADAIDQYLEEVKQGDDGKYYYQYGTEERAVEQKEVSIPYRDGKEIKSRSFTIYRTHHGPIVGKKEGRWIAYRMMDRPLDALTQDFLRTKTKGYGSFKKTMKIRTNSSNNTVFADYKGNIAYWHGNYLPKRNPEYDYSGYVDGSDPQQDWQGLHTPGQMIRLRNPKTNWLQNCNSTPFTAAATESPDPGKYPAYAAPDKDNFRSIHANNLLASISNYTLDSLIKVANDPHLVAFDRLIPLLEEAFENKGDDQDRQLVSAYMALKTWDRNYGVSSVSTTLAILWAEKVLGLAYQQTPEAVRKEMLFDAWIKDYVTDEQMVTALKEVVAQLERDFGNWQTPWGLINRYQRLSNAIDPTFDDLRPSLPVGFTSSRWGAIAAIESQTYEGSKRRYGLHGNSFVAVISFGKRLRAKAIVTGGQSGHMRSPHFDDQSKAFCNQEFREVYFYRPEVEAQAAETYHPGEKRQAF